MNRRECGMRYTFEKLVLMVEKIWKIREYRRGKDE